ncbi:MAG: hypothetical protein ISR96_03105 [Nitrospira sp.]|nr:hypothetical protein [Nitrospira sp.]
MTLKEIITALDATVLTEGDIDISVQHACSADLMSDVLYYCKANSLLITGLIQPHVVRTAEIAGIKAILFVQNKKPDITTIELAQKKKIPLLNTSLCMYKASGILFKYDLNGCG